MRLELEDAQQMLSKTQKRYEKPTAECSVGELVWRLCMLVADVGGLAMLQGVSGDEATVATIREVSDLVEGLRDEAIEEIDAVFAKHADRIVEIDRRLRDVRSRHTPIGGAR